MIISLLQCCFFSARITRHPTQGKAAENSGPNWQKKTDRHFLLPSPLRAYILESVGLSRYGGREVTNRKRQPNQVIRIMFRTEKE
jgi:hypothetical protein